jgi:hypothetical protein
MSTKPSHLTIRPGSHVWVWGLLGTVVTDPRTPEGAIAIDDGYKVGFWDPSIVDVLTREEFEHLRDGGVHPAERTF